MFSPTGILSFATSIAFSALLLSQETAQVSKSKLWHLTVSRISR